MTDITSADYRSAAQKVRKALLEIGLGPHIESLTVLGIAHMEAEADRLESTDLAAQLAMAYIDALHRSGLTHNTWAYLPDAQRSEIHHGMQFVEAYLQSTGRLIPAGGMALTAEQVEDVRRLLDELASERDECDTWDLYERLRALFPSTEPAEDSVGDPLQAWKGFLKPKPIGWYRTMELDFAAEHFGFPVKPDSGDWFTASDGGKWCSESNEWELRYYPPTPAEPAEEETKAERRDPDELAKRMALIWEGGWDEFDEKERDCLRCAAEIARAYYASSPVVPAPTEVSVIGQAAVALRAALAVVDPLEDGDWEHAWRTVEDLEDCAKRAETIAPTETGLWHHRDGRICVYAPAVTPRLRYRIGKFNDHGDFVHDDSERQLPEGFAPFVAAPTGTGPWQTVKSDG